MSDHFSREECEAVEEDLAELALGNLSGRRRSDALSHVEACRRCSAELAELCLAADTLVQLAPQAEPPLGFEQRLTERLQASGVARRVRRPLRVRALAAAAVVLAALGFGLGAIVTSGGGNGTGATGINLASAPLSWHGRVLGEVFVSRGTPSWMFMSVDGGNWRGWVTCELLLAGGRVDTVGTFELSHGSGAWGAPLTTSAGQVRGARLLAGGAVVASAHLSS